MYMCISIRIYYLYLRQIEYSTDIGFGAPVQVL